MKHKSLLVYVPCLDGGCEDVGRIELDGHTLVSDERLRELEEAEQAADEIESLQRYRTAYNEWIDKTEWMQKSLPAKYLGMHRADAIKDMISELENRLEAAEKDVALKERVIDALGSELNAVANERDTLHTALEKIADWDSAWGPYPETNEAWRAMAIVTAREAAPRRGEKK